MSTSRDFATLAHASATLTQLVLPSFGFLGPAAVWLIKRDDPVVVAHAKSALLFQLAMMFASWAIGLIAGASFIFFLVGILAVVPWFLGVVLPIVAAVRTYAGEPWRYPLTDPVPRAALI